MNIYPTILEKSADDLFEYLRQILNIFDHFQIDIADGILVDNKTVSLQEILSHIQAHDSDIPRNKTFEFHLMVEDYMQSAADVLKLSPWMNISSILFHFRPFKENAYAMPDVDIDLGISLNPEDSVEENWEHLHHFNIIQIMTIQPGRQGNPFIPEMLAKITDLRQHGYSGEIILDGGMNDVNLGHVMKQKHRPDSICPGSYFRSGDQARKLETLKKIAAIENPEQHL